MFPLSDFNTSPVSQPVTSMDDVASINWHGIIRYSDRVSWAIQTFGWSSLHSGLFRQRFYGRLTELQHFRNLINLHNNFCIVVMYRRTPSNYINCKFNQLFAALSMRYVCGNCVLEQSMMLASPFELIYLTFRAFLILDFRYQSFFLSPQAFISVKMAYVWTVKVNKEWENPARFGEHERSILIVIE